jgi:thiol-disulfide isomerase/thioredoxin
MLLLALVALGCQPPVGDSSDGRVPDFSLIDLNPASPRSGAPVSPRDYEGQVSGWYFGHSSCGYCQGQFGLLNQLQQELDAEAPGAVQLLGVNASGLEAANAAMTAGRALPWLQDRLDVGAWTAWRAQLRDVVVVDRAGVVRSVYNLTQHDLHQPTAYGTMKQLLLDARTP